MSGEWRCGDSEDGGEEDGWMGGEEGGGGVGEW